MNKMKALVKKYAEPGIWMDEVPIPEYGPNDVLIKIKKMGTKNYSCTYACRP